LKERLARMHPRVRTAERVYLEETGKVEGTTDASDAFRATGRPSEELYREATVIRDRFALGGTLLGGFLGLVVAGKLVTLSVRRGRSDYEADRAGCFACGRCYQYCPKERQRWKRRTVVARC
jgi:NosR/NirI family nitrous oxide reductase transcriptional regulator